VAFYMDKEHLKEGSDSMQSGYQDIRYVAAWEVLLKIECQFHYKEISRIFDDMTFPAYLKSLVCTSMCSDQRLELITF
jgi:hypothetical protein